MQPTDLAYSRKGDNWTWTDEQNYLDGLGFWSRSFSRDRKSLLISYVQTLELRNPRPAWFDQAMNYARMLVALEENQ